MKDKIWLVGSGIMAAEYDKVLKGLKREFIVIGRGEKTAKKYEEMTGTPVIVGGIQSYIETNPVVPKFAIVAVNVEQLNIVSKELIKFGVKHILLEKPGGLNKDEIEDLRITAKNYGAEIYIAYNRRFYSATIKALEIIEEDAGVKSFNFEFTEWSHIIADLETAKIVKENWFLANSTHVVDLAFYLGGKPREMASYVSGGIEWHPNASVFVGAGISDKEALFSYQANWEAPGRWSVEILTKKHRLIFRPMEKLQIQKIGSVAIEMVEIDYSIDTDYKPGLYKQTEAFLNEDKSKICMIEEQVENMKWYNKIENYGGKVERKGV